MNLGIEVELTQLSKSIYDRLAKRGITQKVKPMLSAVNNRKDFPVIGRLHEHE